MPIKYKHARTHTRARAHTHTCRPTPAHAAAVLGQRFERDKRVDWKLELIRRRNVLEAVQVVTLLCWLASLSVSQLVGSRSSSTAAMHWRPCRPVRVSLNAEC